MKFEKITKEEKIKQFDKMFKEVQKICNKNEDIWGEDTLYHACKTAGFMFYEFLSEKEI